MRLAISRAVAKQTPRGWRIAKEKATHKIDCVVALAMACHAAVDRGYEQENPIVVPGYYVGGEEISAPRVLTPKPQQEPAVQSEYFSTQTSDRRPPPHYLESYQRQNEPWRPYVSGGYSRVPGGVLHLPLPSWWGKR